MLEKPLFTEEEIKTRIKQLAEQITIDYKDKDLIAIGVLKGACVFFSDLIRHINMPLAVDFIIASSYVKKESSGNIKIHYDIRETIEGKDVLLIEDIVDTGITIDYLVKEISLKNPNSIKVCALLDKKDRRKVEAPIDYIGFDIPDLFIIGYGIDYENQYRNLPYITVYDSEG